MFVLLLAVVVFALCVAKSAWLQPEQIQRNYILALMLCTVGMLAFATGRLAFALVVGGALFYELAFIAAVKFRYLESPLMLSDFVYFVRGSLVQTLGQYPHLWRSAIYTVVIVPLLLWLVWRNDRPLFGRMRSTGLRLGARVAGVAACAMLAWLCLRPDGVFAGVYRADLWSKLSDDAHMTNFFVTAHDMRPTLPPMSDAATAERDWGDTAQGRAPAGAPPDARPDIIQVLEESTFDPSGFAGCTIAQCRVQMFQPDEYTRAHGPLRTHTFGGGTWVSEFASITGMPQSIFGPAGAYAPFVLAPRMHDSLPMQLGRMGYLTIAVYPANGGFINARNAYQAYGFDKFYDIDDLGMKMWHANDEQMFAAAKKIYDENRKAGRPIFMMVLTMAQHGPHDKHPLKELPAPFDQGLLPDLPQAQELNLSAYLAQLQESDKGMSQLERDFLHRPEPTVIMHFGDHQPSFSGVIREMPRTVPAGLEPYRDSLTYFMLKSNFAGPTLPNYPMVDIAYLPSMVLRTAGLPADPYFSALESLETRCGGLYEECPDKSLLHSYHAWIFDHLHVYR
ncbi:sulfatase-like hydrolase/transferase [Frateuria sp. Soil773]|uniref:LTA synthase family protein n=1 Tax=Frateuria sp. Soil773 TaxID=1736407 RepID=UPI000A5EF4B0|nr:sulfatase-like hydrolase/transferase [Frateuria sp. Soil773]